MNGHQHLQGIRAGSGNSVAAIRCPLCEAVLEATEIADGFELTCRACGFHHRYAERPQEEPANLCSEVCGKNLPDGGQSEAQTLAIDPLEQWLAGGEIQPVQLSLLRRTVKWQRQHPKLAFFVSLLLVTLLAVALGSVAACFRTTQSLDQLIVKDDLLKGKLQQWQQKAEQFERDFRAAENHCENESSQRQNAEAKLRQLQTDYERSESLRSEVELQLHRSQIDARYAVVREMSAQAVALTNSPLRKLLLCSDTLRILQSANLPTDVPSLQFVFDIAAESGSSLLADRKSSTLTVATSADGQWLASGGADGTVRLWNLQKAQPDSTVKVLTGHHSRINDLLFTRDGQWLVSAGSDTTVRVWNLRSQHPEAGSLELAGHKGRVNRLASSADGRWLLTCSTGITMPENSLRRWDLHAENPGMGSSEFTGFEGRIESIAISPNGMWIVASNDTGSTWLWNLAAEKQATSRQLISQGEGTNRTIATFTPDGRWLVLGAERTNGQDHSVELYNLAADGVSEIPVTLPGTTKGTRALAVSPNSRWLFTSEGGRSVRVWDLTLPDFTQHAAVLNDAPQNPEMLRPSADGKWLVAAGNSGAVWMWSMGQQGPVEHPVTLRTGQGRVNAMVVSADSHWLATADERGELRLWNLSADELVQHALDQQLHRDDTEQTIAKLLQLSEPDLVR